MHEVFKIKSSKTNPKFQQYLINFEKPQFFKENPETSVSKTWMHEMQENRSLPREEKLGEAWRNLVEQIWGKKENVWERKQQSNETDIEKMTGRSYEKLKLSSQ